MQRASGNRQLSSRARARLPTKIIMMVEAPKPMEPSAMPIKIVNDRDQADNR
jgi:hypothetical protein